MSADSPHQGNADGAPPAQAHGHSPGHAHGHSHGHSHEFEGDWSAWLALPALRAILLAIAAAGVATVVGLIALWPDGSGKAAALEEAQFLGLAPEIYPAVIDDTFDDTCSYGTIDNDRQCRFYSFIPEEGPDAGALMFLPEYDLDAVAPDPGLAPGDHIFVAREPRTDFYFYYDRDRGSVLLWLVAAFSLVVLALGRFRGFLALLSLALTVAVLAVFVAPSVLDGNDPLLVAVVAGSAIAFLSLYLTHGFTPTTTVALAGTLASLLLTLGVSSLFFSAAQFTGLATEEGLTLPLLAEVNLSSLLLAGAVIGALGALDDVTVTQVATVAELRYRNENLSVSELVASGIRVGREHIASTVNTLLLAYAGASMPLLLLVAASDQALGDVANSELVAVEIVRTLCGSIGLVAAVPVTTFLAAVLVGTSPASVLKASEHDESPDDAPASDEDPSGETAVGEAPGPATPGADAPEIAAPDGDQASSEDTRWVPAGDDARWEDFGPQE